MADPEPREPVRADQESNELVPGSDTDAVRARSVAEEVLSEPPRRPVEAADEDDQASAAGGDDSDTAGEIGDTH